MKVRHQLTVAFLLATTSVLWQVPAGNAQGSSSHRLKPLGPDPGPGLAFSRGAGSLTLTWGDSAKGLFLQSTPVIAGTNKHWTLVSGMTDRIAGAGSWTNSNLTGPARFYRLASYMPAPKTVNVPESAPGDRAHPSSLTVLLKPESVLVELGDS